MISGNSTSTLSRLENIACKGEVNSPLRCNNLKRLNWRSPLGKRGMNVLSLWWIFVISFIAVTVIIGVGMFYGKEVDAREAEANLLAERVLSCISRQGIMSINELQQFDVYRDCRLRSDAFIAGSSYYLNVSFYNSSGGNLRPEVIGGKSSFASDCRVIGGGIEGENYPKCVERKEPLVYFEGHVRKEGSVILLAASNQFGKTGGIS